MQITRNFYAQMLNEAIRARSESLTIANYVLVTLVMILLAILTVVSARGLQT